MREIVHLQAGQCGNQIGAKVGAARGRGRGRTGPSLTPLGVPGANVVLSGPAAPQAQTFPRLCTAEPGVTFSGSGGNSAA